MNFNFIKQFDIWLANLEPGFGTEPGKTKPVIVIQSDLLNRVHPSTIVFPVTTQKNSQTTNIIKIPISKMETNLKKDSFIIVDQIRAIDNKLFVKKIGLLSPNSINKLKKSIFLIFDL